jgi:hypothetical protein
VRSGLAGFALSLTLLWCAPSFAQQPRFPVDQNRLAIGAREKTPDWTRDKEGNETGAGKPKYSARSALEYDRCASVISF